MTQSQLARIIDAALEVPIVPSFSRIGYGVREKLFDWDEQPVSLDGQFALVTGATSGIGRATAKGLLRLGADVLVTSRSAERAEKAARVLNRAKLAGEATGVALDTGDFDSVDQLAAFVAEQGRPLDMLLNNAGALMPEYQIDGRGMELTLSSHLVGPYRLLNQLRPHLVDGARVVFMSSGGMYTQGLDVDTIEMSKAEYRGAVAYARAKRGQVEMVRFLGPRWAPSVVMHSMHPGWVDTPGVDAGIPVFGKVMGPLLRSAEQGADTMIWLAARGANERPGRFWHDRSERRTSYLPTTSTTDDERSKLIAWLDEQAGVTALLEDSPHEN